MSKVLGIGNALVDILIRLENEELLNELNLRKGSMQLVDRDFKNLVFSTTKHLQKTQASGGSAANTIHGLASLGIETAYIGKVGNDALGDFFLSDLKNNHIKPFLKRSNTETGVASTLITPDSERTFGTYLGAAVEVSPEDLDKSYFKGYTFLHIEGYLVFNTALVETALKMAKANNMQVSLDLASYNVVEANLDFLRDVTAKYVDVVFANEEEAKAFTGKTPEKALDEIASMCNIAVVKVGKNGSLIKQGNDDYRIGAINAKVIDTTGAGDLYAAGFLYGLTRTLPLDQCGHVGALLAGKVIETIGAKIDSCVWDEIKTSVKKIENIESNP
jgi:sugar/nucleoside kinase (ribokinase family)